MFNLFKLVIEGDYGKLTPKSVQAVNTIENYYQELIEEETDSLNFIKTINTIIITAPRKAPSNPLTADLAENCKNLKDTISDLKSLYFVKENNHLKEVVESLEVLKSMIFEEKRKAGILTFSDIAHLSVDILLNNKKIRKIYKDKFKFIMIDEFQDNNQLQKDLTYLLSEKKNESNDTIPTIDSVEKRKLFFVGDEKQSIYRFRDADVSVFKALSKEIEGSGGTVINLGVNYRSEPKLIEYFNKAFAKVFENPKEPFEAEFESLKYRDKIEGLDPKIELYIKSAESKSIISENVEQASSAACEATKIAKVINKMLTSDKYLIPSKNGLKRPEVDDIAILLRSKTHQIEFEKALRAKKIPFIIQDNKAFPLEALTNDIYNILQLIIYPDDKLAYTSVLKGPLASISEKSILLLLNSFDCENLFECDIPLDSKDQENLVAIKKTFDQLVELSTDNDISSLLSFIWWDAGLRYYYICEPNYHLYIDNYDYLYRLAKKFDENQFSLSVFLDEIRDNLGSSSTEEEVAVLKEQAKGVQIMTIHKSKGLEFPIVIVANMGTQIRDKGVSFSIENNIPVPKHCISIDKKTKKEKYDSLFIDRAKALRKEMDLAEIKRILYVALTRAKTHLIMSATIQTTIENEVLGNKNKSLLNMIYNASLDESDQILPYLTVKDIEIVSIYENYVKVEEKPIVERKQFLKNQKYYNEGEEVYDTRARNIAVTKLFAHKDDGNYEEGQPLSNSKVDTLLQKLSETNEDVYTDFGTLCHKYVQNLIMGEPIKSLTDESVLSKGSSLSKLKESQINLIETVAKEYASDFINSQFYNKYVKDNKRKCEVGFFSKVEVENGDFLVVEGFIDLLIKTDNNDYIVVDFKTDKFRNPSIHKNQIETYITAVKRMNPNSCVKGCVVYLRAVDREFFY
ncbi:MAG: 3'-5' exonuclease [Sphaerochaetaceae bacterium]|nr:3'-5' exonuclease [Sphaerochaetaceae bacterium]